MIAIDPLAGHAHCQTDTPLPHAFAVRSALSGVALALISLAPMGARGQQSTDRAFSLDSLLSIRISTASKYSQTSAEAPASVTVLGADEIRQFGFRNVGEALESVRGIYFSSDRNYPYLGTRGFGRPTDYNNRVLVLIDGHTLNEHVWGGAPVGWDLPIALEAVERIEIVRGPGSAMYGSSAMFAVINIVTKSGIELDGLTVNGAIGSGGARQGSFAAGRSLGARTSFAVSGLLLRSDGKPQYYPEFDAVESNFGVVRNLDWTEGISGLASLTMGDVSARVGYRSSHKGIPTASYGAIFGDDRAETVDENLWSELVARWTVGASYRVQVRTYADRFRYRGVYPSLEDPLYSDGGGSSSAGAEGILIWDQNSRHRLTIGSEYRTVWRVEYRERQLDGNVKEDRAPFDVRSVFVQDELHLASSLTLVSGLRGEKRSNGRGAVAPRVGLVATPDRQTTVKLLYGEAYRDPTPSEAHLSTGTYERNPALKAERIRTLELEVQRRLGAPVLLEASLFDYRVRNLIDQVEHGLSLQFRNVAASRGRGVELQLDVHPELPWSARAQYTMQDAADQTTGTQLTNSPRHTASLSTIARGAGGLHSALTVRYESARRTLGNTWTNDFTRADLHLGYSTTANARPRWWSGLDVSLRVTNLLDTRYSVPAGFEHVQSVIPQDGRMLSLRLGRSL